MNQRILCHFEMLVNEKYYQFSFQPGVVNFDDLDNALEAFKAELDILKEKAIAAQAELDEKAAPEASASEASASEPVVEGMGESVDSVDADKPELVAK